MISCGRGVILEGENPRVSPSNHENIPTYPFDGHKHFPLLLGASSLHCEAPHGLLADVGSLCQFSIFTLYLLLELLLSLFCLQGNCLVW